MYGYVIIPPSKGPTNQPGILWGMPLPRRPAWEFSSVLEAVWAARRRQLYPAGGRPWATGTGKDVFISDPQKDARN